VRGEREGDRQEFRGRKEGHSLKRDSIEGKSGEGSPSKITGGRIGTCGEWSSFQPRACDICKEGEGEGLEKERKERTSRSSDVGEVSGGF